MQLQARTYDQYISRCESAEFQYLKFLSARAAELCLFYGVDFLPGMGTYYFKWPQVLEPFYDLHSPVQDVMITDDVIESIASMAYSSTLQELEREMFNSSQSIGTIVNAYSLKQESFTIESLRVVSVVDTDSLAQDDVSPTWMRYLDAKEEEGLIYLGPVLPSVEDAIKGLCVNAEDFDNFGYNALFSIPRLNFSVQKQKQEIFDLRE